jgi:hypothetical protein
MPPVMTAYNRAKRLQDIVPFRVLWLVVEVVVDGFEQLVEHVPGRDKSFEPGIGSAVVVAHLSLASPTAGIGFS